MPAFAVARGKLERSDAAMLAVPATTDGEGGDVLVGPGANEVAAAYGIDLEQELDHLGFDGKLATTARIPLRGDGSAESLVVVGLGPQDGVEDELLRRAAAAVADVAAGVATLATTLPAAGTDPTSAAQAVVEGLDLATYRFNTYKSEADEHALERVTVHPAGDAKPAALRRGVEAGATICGAVRLARDLVNEPPGAKRPPDLARRAKALLRGTGVKVRILDEDALEKGGYGGLLGVGAGSTAPPRLVELRYEPSGAKTHVALVGKGITFDSGGLSLKPAGGMTTMKMDMAGAASVLATVKAAAELDLAVRVTGLMALAENMPSGTATRPGDVLTIRGGKTVEVLNTDAEGRLVLADALAHAGEAKPDAIVDLATLTGAVVTALGSRIAGLMARDEDLAEALLDASDLAGERLWRLPLAHDLYGEDLKGDVADVKNAGWSGAGTVRAGLFLGEFVPAGIPWAHLDIAGVAWSDAPSVGYLRKGATGVPVRTLVAWLRAL